jgi:NADH:ubiquinone oxidoreductase subunit B-like Fe-S oxidoreductase
VSETWETGHRLESRVKLCFANQGCAPRDEMVLEYAFMELVEKIRGETGEDVAMW